MLTQEELDSMREDFTESLPDTARVLRKTMIDDGQGGETEGPPTVVYNGPARLSPMPAWRSSEAETGGAIISSTGWFITLEALTTVYEKDTIEVTLVETGEVRTFEIAAVMDSRTYQLGTRVLATELV